MNNIDIYILTIPISVGLALLMSAYLLWHISRQSSGTDKMIRINKAIREGAKAYLKRQYKVIITILSLITIVLYFAVDYNIHQGTPYVSLSFFLGTISSIIAGYVSMEAATRSNVKVAEAARKSQAKPLQLAFYGGLVLGLMVVSMSLIGVTGLFYFYWLLNGWGNLEKIPELIMGFGFGASLAALFMQLGGGIYTKSADIGADLVGKIEVGIPEDDPRNPAVIADNVGDNVGDCAGRGADLFESISAENIGSMIIGAGLYAILKNPYFIFFPIVARAVGLIATMIGALAVRPKEPTKRIMNGGSIAIEKEKEILIRPVTSLRNGLVVSTILIAILFYFVITGMLGAAAIYLYFASLMGLIAALLIELVTEYYTGDHKPVKSIAEAAKTGPATTILMGLSVGMESTALPVIIVIIALGAAYIFGALYAPYAGLDAHTGGIYGTVTATIGMLSLTGIILAIDGYGPIADNAGGIIEMAGVEEEVGKTTEVLDAAGNTTKALAKGFAMGSAVMASLLLFQAYVDVIRLAAGNKAYQINLVQPSVIIGLILGGMIVFLFASLAIRAVGRTASDIIEEVRRQFREIPGLLEGKAEPQYGKCVDITTKSAQKNMIAPSLIILITPIIVGFLLGPESVGAFLIGVTITGTMLAFFMNTGGAAFDNAKKYLERIGLKKTEQHKAAVVGDTIGDPLKDTAGPSIHIVLKLVNNVAIVMGALFVLYALSLLP